MKNPTRQTVLFEDLFSRPAHIAFDEPLQSSDGGLPLLAALDRGLGLTERLARHIPDNRQPGKVVHSRLDLFRQRVFALAAGYGDCNDAERIAGDPVLKESCERDALCDHDLGSQPTLSRFESAASARDVVDMLRDFEDFVVEHHKKRLRGKAGEIIIDLDPTDDPTHGQQKFAFFNRHYHGYCFLPILGFLTFDDEPDQYLFLARLRPGLASARRGGLRVLRRVVAKLRKAFPKAEIIVRLDGGFAAPETLDVLEDLEVKYVVGIGKNKRLLRLAEPSMAKARAKHDKTGLMARHFSSFRYAASTWKNKQRRVVVKAQITVHPTRDPRDNPRFVVTNLRERADLVYEFYGRRGEAENRIKELDNDLELGRTSCSTFVANQLRVLISATAYVLFQELRLRAARTEFARCQVGKLRERLLKIGARVVVSVRRLVLHFPMAYPWQDAWRRIALAVGAAPA
ncbi:MAG: IS1380 family transposase [Planctomycetota bacterium]